MWAQLIKARLKPGTSEEFAQILKQIHAMEQPGTGLVRSTTMRDQADPNSFAMIVVFESEAKARERELDPKRQPQMRDLQDRMAAIFDGPPEFVNFEVMDEYPA